MWKLRRCGRPRPALQSDELVSLILEQLQQPLQKRIGAGLDFVELVVDPVEKLDGAPDGSVTEWFPVVHATHAVSRVAAGVGNCSSFTEQ